jgi:purine operon repressor
MGRTTVMRDRVERLVALARLVTAHPGAHISLASLAEALNVAKSTLSEDLAVVRDALLAQGLGEVATQVGAAGGIRFRPDLDHHWARQALETLIEQLGQPDRITGGGFLYMTDVLFDPALMEPMGVLLAERLEAGRPQFVATVETKGIPLALAVARVLMVPVILIRRDNRLSEGSSLSINYLSGSSHRIQSMSLARRSPVRGARVVYVDDFLKAGGTARAAQDLLGEFQAEMTGVGVLVATRQPPDKLVTNIAACLEWAEDSGIAPAGWVQTRLGLAEGTKDSHGHD